MRLSRAVSAAVLILTAGCAPLKSVIGEKPADELRFERTSFAKLDGWTAGDPKAALAAFVASCKRVVKRNDGDTFGGVAAYGTVGEWRGACSAVLQTSGDARQFFEAWFEPVMASNRDEAVGLFTGYYEPELAGSRTASGKFTTPLYTRPSDLVSVDLGTFRPALKGERIAGRVDDARLVPYATRGQIVSAGLGGRSSVIAYVDDAVGAFFLQIQGSGRVRFPNGEVVRVAYDGQNGHPYTAVGRVLVERGDVRREDMSMQRIRSWLAANPAKADALMNENASFVFFKEQPIADPALGAEGAQSVSLTPEASLAVDLKFHGLGAPMWIDATAPAEAGPDVVFRRLVIAQDTGGAIRGPVRGDVYWGAGKRAEEIAGRMAHRGRLYVLLPKSVAARLN
ncbi:MAG: murein transglycosylase A [Micropepsaceae bacterium]